MQTKIYAEPLIECVSLQDLKEHLRLDSGSFLDNLTIVQSIVPDSYALGVGFATLGGYTSVLGYQAVVILDSGTNAATGTVDAKIQESDDHVNWTDWAGGAFTQVTTANDNAIQKIAYTGTKQYIRVVAKILLATCDFGVSIAKYSSDVTEDTLLATIITAARQQAEAYTRRAFVTQTWDAFLDEFPKNNFISLPYGQLQSIVTMAYSNSAGTSTPMTVTTDYLVDSSSEPGRIVLPYGLSWPSPSTYYPVNPIAIRWICGYGVTAASVPAGIRTAIKMMAADYYSARGERYIGAGSVIENKTAEKILYKFRLWDF
jgi:uncharacterized phiE125 gp8 family phage protein